MTYVVPQINQFNYKPFVLMDRKKVKTHKFIVDKYSHFGDEHICKKCNMYAVIERKWYFVNKFYSHDNLSCEEYIIKSIIQ